MYLSLVNVFFTIQRRSVVIYLHDGVAGGCRGLHNKSKQMCPESQ